MKIFKWLCMMGLLLATTACEKEPIYQNLQKLQFTATVEPLQSNDPNAKVYLHNEEWIYWELGDRISLGSNKTNTEATPPDADLVNSSPGGDFDHFNGVFISSQPDGSCYFLGLHPYSTNNIIKGSGLDNGVSGAEFFSKIVIDLPATQPRRMGDKEDITFAKQVFPMVAWYGDEWDSPEHAFNLNFHALGGIVRLELFNASGVTADVDDITFTVIEDAYNDNAQLCGKFNVNDYNTNFPYLTRTESPITSKTITLEGPTMPFEPDDLKTFYLVLPSMSGALTTKYHLRMTVTSDQGTFSKDFKVPIRRNGITNMNALGVTDWNAAPTTVGLAGHGTKERPFKIYTVADLVYLRDCYNSVGRKINGQPITKDTYISLMRSDIELTPSNWSGSSIIDFLGHFTDAEHEPVNPGITNKSNIALFENIQDSGFVTGIVVKTDGTTLTTTSATGVSPFCNINRGIIRNCIVRGTVSASSSDLAGLVGQNLDGGQIIACACEASLTASGNVAGICLHNVSSVGHESTINECHTINTLTMSATRAAGICYDNRGLLKDSYFSATIAAGASNWGGIVYENGTGGRTRNCYNSGTITTTGTVGGIAHTVSGDSVNYCRLEGPLNGIQVGGIAYTVTGGTVINCYANNASASVTVNTTGGTQYGAGLVGTLSGGKVENSFVRNVSISATSSGPTLGGLIGNVTGGTVNNCYAYETYTHTFYGSKSGGTLNYCYLVNYNQTDVTRVNTPLDASFASDLNGHKPTGGYTWSGIPPVLAP